MRIPAPLQPIARFIQRYNNGDADRDAAALAYGTLVVTVPLVALAAAIAGWALRGHPTAQREIAAAVERAIPGGGEMVGAGLKGAGRSAATFTLVAVVFTAWTSLGLVSRLRTAVERAWGDPPFPGIRAGLLAKAHDLLLGLVMAAIVIASAVLSSLSVADRLPDWGSFFERGIGVLVGAVVDGIIVVVAMTVLPRRQHSVRSVAVPALAAVGGLTVTKTLGASLVRGAAERAGPGYGIGLGIIAAAVAAYLSARILLAATHWAAIRAGRPMPA